ncbi:MAG: family 43 glycosylhydrolase [Flavobacteriales bacterium]|nr:family 43 glycosylhydrolase [Flavobacteriales bacterium]
MRNYLPLTLIACLVATISCNKNKPKPNTEWERDNQNPVLRDYYSGEDYQSASDGHVFYVDNELYMIYSGDAGGVSSIKLARGNSLTDWEILGPILSEPNSENTDISKETSFYRKADNGKHQIYYIGYTDGSTYQSQIFLAEADSIDGVYSQIPTPVVPRGEIAGKNVYLITSPSVVEHDGLLYMMFIGWNNSPENVSEVWMMGATSNDDGYTWSDFQIVNTPIGMEGQVTKTPDGKFVAVSTGDYKGDEALYYATSNHPFGPYETSDNPIITKNGSGLEKDEIIAPQITFDKTTGEEYLYYTGADHQQGWWMMLAKRK